MVAAADHYFFDISSVNFRCPAPSGTAPGAALNAALTVAPSPGFRYFSAGPAAAAPPNLTLTVQMPWGAPLQTIRSGPTPTAAPRAPTWLPNRRAFICCA
jgi:hypothetical protein